jgi:hypothetical protein
VIQSCDGLVLGGFNSSFTAWWSVEIRSKAQRFVVAVVSELLVMDRGTSPLKRMVSYRDNKKHRRLHVHRIQKPRHDGKTKCKTILFQT